MAIISLNNERKQAGEFALLETDVYRMKIVRAHIEVDQYAEKRKDGTQPEKLVLCWEVSEAGPEQDEDVVGLSVWQRMNPYYGTIREGGVSKFKAFLDSLAEQGLIELDPAAGFDTDSLIGLEQRVGVEKYIKTMGPNAGQPGNRVVSILPLKRKATKQGTPPARRNVPEAVEESGDDGDLF
jgi:hypothetical protein